MTNKYHIYLISDSTGETLNRIFLAIQSQFANFSYEKKEFVFIRTSQQINEIIRECKDIKNSIILYTVVDTKLAKYLGNECLKKNIPCFGVLGNLILSFSKLLNQKATHKASAQHVLDEDYYKRIEAIQFTMSHDDGKIIKDLDKSDIILVGVSRTSKTPTSIYLANRGYRTANIPIIPGKNLPEEVINSSKKTCTVGLICDPARLSDVRKNRIQSMHEDRPVTYTNESKIKIELENSKNLFRKNNWPIIDVTRKSVEETAAAIIKISDIMKTK